MWGGVTPILGFCRVWAICGGLGGLISGEFDWLVVRLILVGLGWWGLACWLICLCVGLV